MEMSLRERMTAVYEGRTPDRVPLILDLSHYFLWKYKKPWSMLGIYSEPDRDLIDFNRKFGAGFYVLNQVPLFEVYYEGDVKSQAWVEEKSGKTETHWRFETPRGSIERIREWNDTTYAWATSRYGIKTEDDIRIFADAMSARRYKPVFENWYAWDEYIGESGIASIQPGYSGMGYLLHYWMGIEDTIYACYDWRDTVHEAVDRVNANNLEAVKKLMELPGPVVLMGDNFSSDCQPPAFFNEWSAPFYRQVADIVHESGKKLSLHVDGLLRGAIGMVRDIGADVIDGTTPKPMGDLTAQECRDEAGDKLILSGGMSPNLWQPNVPVERFDQAVLEWLELKKRSSALIVAAGCQVPPGAEEYKIDRIRRLVEEYGKY